MPCRALTPGGMPQPSPSLPANAAVSAAPAAQHGTPHSLCEMIHAALIAVGGQAYLARQAQENPRAFLALIAKLLAAELRPAQAPRRGRDGSATPAAQHGAARPGEVRPGEVRPGEVRPGEARPGEARPGEARPEQAAPKAAKQGKEDSRAFFSLIGKLLTAELKESRAPRRAHAGSTEQAAQATADTAPAAPAVEIRAPVACCTISRQPSPGTACGSERTPRAAVVDLSHQRLWKHATTWRPSFSERWRRASCGAVGLGVGLAEFLPACAAPAPGFLEVAA